MGLVETVIIIFLAYLIGSLSSAILICKLFKLPDPRTQGSHNPGATNVLRIGGKKAAILTLLGDALKGAIPVLLAKWYGVNDLTLALITLAVFLGHLFPIFFRFAGGKGVATALGSLFALCWPAGLCWLAIWLLTALIFRYSSLASLTASLLIPVYLWYFTHNSLFTALFVLIACLLLYRHRKNISNLLAGSENKIGKSKLA